jgi:hypothetical protein
VTTQAKLSPARREELLMHSAAIFFGWFMLGYGLFGLKLPLFIIKLPDDKDGPWESWFEKWGPHIVASSTSKMDNGLF